MRILEHRGKVMKEQGISIITSEWELGAGKIGTAAGPQVILNAIKSNDRELLNNTPISSMAWSSAPHQQTDYSGESHHHNARPNLKNGAALLSHQTAFAAEVSQHIKANNKCLLLTADHSNGIGGASGLCKEVEAAKVGVIWIDAHYDLHSPYTTPSGNSHGMAVNALIDDNNTENAEQGISPEEATLWESIKSIKGTGNALPTQNLVFIGVRDYEPAEASLVLKHQICSIQPEEVATKGISAVVQKAMAHLSHCEYLYVSFDVDSMDPSVSHATGTPVEGGLSLDQAKVLLNSLLQDERVRCLEITEFNPSLPEPEAMLAAIESLLMDSNLFK